MLIDSSTFSYIAICSFFWFCVSLFLSQIQRQNNNEWNGDVFIALCRTCLSIAKRGTLISNVARGSSVCFYQPPAMRFKTFHLVQRTICAPESAEGEGGICRQNREMKKIESSFRLASLMLFLAYGILVGAHAFLYKWKTKWWRKRKKKDFTSESCLQMR